MYINWISSFFRATFADSNRRQVRLWWWRLLIFQEINLQLGIGLEFCTSLAIKKQFNWMNLYHAIQNATHSVVCESTWPHFVWFCISYQNQPKLSHTCALCDIEYHVAAELSTKAYNRWITIFKPTIHEPRVILNHEISEANFSHSVLHKFKAILFAARSFDDINHIGWWISH